MVTINLLPNLVLERRRQARLTQIATIATIAWVLVAVVVVLLALTFKEYENHQVSGLTNQYNSLNGDVNSTDNINFRATAAAVQTSLKALDQLQSSYLDPKTILNTVDSLLPRGAYLTDVKLGQANSVSVSAKANSIAEAIKLYYAISQSQSNSKNGSFSYFTNVTWTGINSDGGNTVPISVSGTFVQGSGQ